MAGKRIAVRYECLGLIGVTALIGLACSGGASSSGMRGGDVADAGPAPPAKGCVTDTYCAVNAPVAPCPSGYDCNAAFAPPRCTRLYCGTVGSGCSADVQCNLGMICGVGHACAADLVTDFIGTWAFTSGTDVAQCGDSTDPEAASGGLAIGHGAGSSLSVNLDNFLRDIGDAVAGCTVPFSVVGSVATIYSDQACAVRTTIGQTTIRFDEFTMSLGADHLTLTIHARETALSDCKILIDGNLTRK